jgi:hypothetical protein
VGSVYPRKNKLWLRFKGADGEWTQCKTPFHVGEEDAARKLLRKVENKIAAGLEVQGPEATGPLTLARYAERWNEERSKLGLADWKSDRSRLRDHVLPSLGSMALDEVRPRHLADLFRRLRGSGKTGTENDPQRLQRDDGSLPRRSARGPHRHVAVHPDQVPTRRERRQEPRLASDRHLHASGARDAHRGRAHPVGSPGALRARGHRSSPSWRSCRAAMGGLRPDAKASRAARDLELLRQGPHEDEACSLHAGASDLGWNARGVAAQWLAGDDGALGHARGPHRADAEEPPHRAWLDAIEERLAQATLDGPRDARAPASTRPRPAPDDDLAHAYGRRAKGSPRALHAHAAQGQHDRRLHGVSVGVALRRGRETQAPS